MRAATKKSPESATPKKAARSPFTRKAMLECMREILSRGPSEAVWEELKGHASADREKVLNLYKRSVHRRIEWGGFGPLSAVADGGDYPRVTFRAGAKPKGEVVGQVVGPCFALNAHEGDDLVQLVADAAGVKLVDDVPKKVARSAIIEDTNDLITPTPSARRELPPERYQISRKAVVNTIAYHVSCHRALARSAERTNAKHRPRLLAEAQKELAFAENAIMELEALASDHDVDLVLKELKEVYQWEPRDIRPVKMTRIPRQVRAAHTLGQVPNKGRRMASVPLWKPFPDHPGTTIPKDYKDPGFTGISDWSHYPVLQQGNYETHTLQVSARIYAKAKVGLQDGIPVMGYDWLDMSGGGGCAPGRKWGEFPTLKDAEIYAWEHLQGKLDERVRMGSDSAKVKQDLRKLLQKISARLAELQGDAEAAPTATGLQLQLPSTAPLPEGYAKAKDLKPGMVVLPPRRKQAAVVKSVELYGKSCSIMFEGGHVGMNVNPLQPVQLVQVQHVAMDADASPETVAAVREVAAKAYTHKPGKKSPGIDTVAEAIAMVRSPEYVHRCIRAVLVHRPRMLERWNGLRGKLITDKVLLQHVAASWPNGTTLNEQAFTADGCTMLCVGYHNPEFMPRIMFQGTWYNGMWYRQDDLSELVAEVMEVQLQHHKPKHTKAARFRRAGDVEITKHQLDLLEKVATKAKKKKPGHQGGDVLPDGTMVVDPTNALLELHDAANGVHVQFTQPVPLDQLSASFVVPVDAAHNAKLKLNVATPPATAATPEPQAPVIPYTPITGYVGPNTLTELAAPFGTDRREREVVKKRFRSMYGKLSTWPADQRRAFIQYITNTLP